MKEDLEQIKPLPSVLNQEYIASNQSDRVDNIYKGTSQQCIDKVRADIQDMKKRVDKVVVLWTANTEMYMLPVIDSLSDLKSMVERNVSLPASVLFAVAAIEEQVLYLNGSPQNTFHPGIVEY